MLGLPMVSGCLVSLGFSGFGSLVLGFKASEFRFVWLFESLSLCQSFRGCLISKS